ncbi:hypothetical protein V500_08379 [Pseudogymnoascus sp. VKM F-4518 (FW-2643)]|nr:hypothetical protein V500_08379 [Pseudogymnoascus sp. VKM F-4518 (FW-2643)]
MAPRRGGGYSSGSSSCSYCNVPMTLGGHAWLSPRTNALFALSIILLLVLVACMILTRRFKWIRERGTDKLRNSGYLTAAVFMFCNYLLQVVFTALGESYVVVTYMIYIGFIFEYIFSRVADVLIVAIIARTITEDVGTLSQKIANWAVGFLWLITIILLGFDIASYAEYMAIGGPEYIAYGGRLYTAIILSSYLFAFTLYLSALAIFAVLKRRSTGTLLMVVIVMPSLFIKTLLELVTQAVFNFTNTRRISITSYNLLYASYVISILATMAIFLTVALIGGLRQRHSDASGITQEQKFAQPGPSYVAVGPYAPPPAPYNAHGTQIPDGQYVQQAPFGTSSQQFQYAPPQYGQAGQQQYAQYPAPGHKDRLTGSVCGTGCGVARAVWGPVVVGVAAAPA